MVLVSLMVGRWMAWWSGVIRGPVPAARRSGVPCPMVLFLTLHLSRCWCSCRWLPLGTASTGPGRALTGGPRRCGVSLAMGRRGEGPRRAKVGRGMQTPLFSKIKEGQLRPTPRRRLSPTCPRSPLASCNHARTRRTMSSWLFWCYRLLVQQRHVLILHSFLVNATWKYVVPYYSEDRFKRSPCLIWTFELLRPRFWFLRHSARIRRARFCDVTVRISRRGSSSQMSLLYFLENRNELEKDDILLLVLTRAGASIQPGNKPPVYQWGP